MQKGSSTSSVLVALDRLDCCSSVVLKDFGPRDTSKRLGPECQTLQQPPRSHLRWTHHSYVASSAMEDLHHVNDCHKSDCPRFACQRGTHDLSLRSGTPFSTDLSRFLEPLLYNETETPKCVPMGPLFGAPLVPSCGSRRLC